MSQLAELVGRNVKRVREDRGLTQDDLQRRLGEEWTRASVGMLESKGVRGDRLYWFAGLCRALETTAAELLSADDVTEPALKDFAQWAPGALAAKRPKAGRRRRVFVSHLGKDNPEEVRRIARQFDLPEQELRMILQEMTGQPSPTAYRDYLAAIDVKATRSEARARRGHATRELRRMVEEFQRGALPGDSTRQADFYVWLRSVEADSDGLD